ncbi:MAG: M48 family metalloprotease [Deltaproteobacteria bacterium]|nr:M48 family metalloprotease [Deltaproteobacteria bacterium]
MKKRKFNQCIISLVFLSAILWLFSCATNPVTGHQELMLLSESNEITLGRKTDAQIAQTYGFYKAPTLATYIDELGKRLAKGSHRPHLSFKFKILDTPVINAFAVPGGYIYVTRGILAHLNSEAELAGVIGHEIGHVAARHSAQQYTRAQFAQFGLGLGAVLSEGFRKYAGVAQFGVGMFFLKFSRDNERQADNLGVEYAIKAGFDATNMANFFSTLRRLHPSSNRDGLPDWFSTHPDPQERIGGVLTMARQWTQRLNAQDLQVNRNTYLHQIDGLIFGQDPRQGYVADGVFYHPELRFYFPVPHGWKLNNIPAQVQMINEKKTAAILFSLGPEHSPKAAARRFISDTGATVIESEATTINSLTAHRVIADIISQQQTVRTMSVFINKGDRIYAFIGFCSPEAFLIYQPVFENTMTRFGPLFDSKKIDVKPDRIRIFLTATSTTLEGVLKSQGVQGNKLKQMAILNGKHLYDTIPANTLLKVVEKG